MEMVRFNEADVIVASGYDQKMTTEGFGNGTNGDGTFIFGNGIRYTTSDIMGSPNVFMNQFNQAFNSNIGHPWDIQFDSKSLKNLIQSEYILDDTDGSYNGTYTWNGTNFTKD